MARILVTEPVHPDALRLLREADQDVVDAAHLTAAEVEAALGEVEVILVRTRKLAPADMAPPLRLIAKHGVGVDNIPLDAARAAGVAVANTPAANANAVAEHTLMLMLALAKALPVMQRAARETGLPERSAPVVDLAGRRLLLVGYGRTGRRVGQLASAFGMEVRVVAPRLGSGRTPEGWRVLRTLGEGLSEADVLSFHCPLTSETRGMLGAAELARLPSGALVINTARGGLIDEVALAEAARAGRIGGFAVDVVEQEPIRPDHPLLGIERGIVTPHSAAMSAEAFRQMGMDAARNILDFLDGRLEPAHIVVPAGRQAAAQG